MEIINHEYYVSLEVAKLLKEAGFDWEGKSYYQGEVFYQYSVDRERIVIMNQNSAPDYMEQYSAPTIEVAQRWLREVHGMHVYVSGFNNYRAYREGSIGATYLTEVFDTYEEAQEAGIKKALELILEKGE